MSTKRVRRHRAGRVLGLMLFLTLVVCALAVAGLLADGLVSSLGAADLPESPAAPLASSVSAGSSAPAAASASSTVTSVPIAAPTTTTSPPSPPSPPVATTTVPAPTFIRLPAATLVVAPSSSSLPAAGEATQYGCPAALAYLAAYAAPVFVSSCPGDAGGHQARTTCWTALPCKSGTIAIADPCPAAYMNEASNSWVLTGVSQAAVDPYGTCRT